MVGKPTPCHELIYNVDFFENKTLEINITINDYEKICAQVLTSEVISGSLESDEQPLFVVVNVE
jgi:hypothetical protein